MVRVFIAIEMPEEIRSDLSEMQADLKEDSKHLIKWVKPAHIHLTLKFIGETPLSRIAEIIHTMDVICKTVKSFNISFSCLGTFPSAGRPRVIWIGVRDEDGKLFTFQSRLEEELIKIGIEREDRQFSPHLTLARLKSTAPSKNLDGITRILNEYRPTKALSMKVDSISVMKSDLKPDGPIHTLIHRSVMSSQLLLHHKT